MATTSAAPAEAGSADDIGLPALDRRAAFRSWAEDYPQPTRRDMPPIDREAIIRVKRMRGKIAKVAKLDRNNQFANRARLIVAGHEDQERRAADPVEQARLHLQRRGNIVFQAHVIGGPRKRWSVDSRSDWLTDAELIALAERHGFNPEKKENVHAR